MEYHENGTINDGAQLRDAADEPQNAGRRNFLRRFGRARTYFYFTLHSLFFGFLAAISGGMFVRLGLGLGRSIINNPFTSYRFNFADGGVEVSKASRLH